MDKNLLSQFHTHQAHVAVVGLGYVGLPLALTFAQAGYRVTGIDIIPERVEMLNQGISHIEDIPSAALAPYIQPLAVSAGTASSTPSPVPSHLDGIDANGNPPTGTFQATTDYSILQSCQAVSICVPTPLRKTGDPDLSYIISAAESVAGNLHAGMVVVLESTTYPGTTTEVLLPLLQKQNDPATDRPLTVGEDFFLAFSPERVDPGRTDWITRNTPKVIGGVTPACREMAMAFYGSAIETLVPVSSPAAAEMVKLFENTFRSVNIALANELLLMCDKLELDAWEVIEAAATKPFGFMKFTPGPGLGGHCIPIDPQYLSWKMRTLEYNARFIQLASEVNTAMPAYWVQRVQDALNEASKAVKGSRVLVLGIAYKRDVSDTREAPALDILHLLQDKGAHIAYHDPHVPTLQTDGLALKSETDLEAALKQADCVLIATDHSAYTWDLVRMHSQCIVDTRHVL